METSLTVLGPGGFSGWEDIINHAGVVLQFPQAYSFRATPREHDAGRHEYKAGFTATG